MKIIPGFETALFLGKNFFLFQYNFKIIIFLLFVWVLEIHFYANFRFRV